MLRVPDVAKVTPGVLYCAQEHALQPNQIHYGRTLRRWSLFISVHVQGSIQQRNQGCLQEQQEEKTPPS